MKENSNTDCVINVKRAEINSELGQSLSGLQVYSNFAQNTKKIIGT